MITGAAGNDFLIGGKGKDRIVGSAGNDILVSGEVSCELDLATLEATVAAALLDLQWRRRESNPRPRTHRSERLQA